MKKKILLSLSAGIVLSILSAMTVYNNTGTEFIKFLGTQLNTYNELQPQEKLYIHFDKPFYYPGDDIWFKAYLVELKNHTPSSQSEIVHVELINPKGSIEQKLSISTKEGNGNGVLQLDKELAGGQYKIKAYTEWMKNYTDSALFEKEIPIQKVTLPKLLMKLDFEKENYAAGETVKARVKIATTENESLAGKEFTYVSQVAGHEGEIVTGVTDENGYATIEFELDKDMNSNDGLLNVMVNHDGNTESIAGNVPIVLKDISLQFFPEGGDMISQVNNKIAFKALNKQGKPADISCDIYDSNGKVVVSSVSITHTFI